MVNVNRGEVALSVGSGEDARVYTLRFSANALCDLEDAVGKPIMQLLDDVRDPKKLSMKTIRSFMWAGLKEHHPKITLMQAGEIVQELTMMGAYAKIAQAAQAAFPGSEVTEDADPLEPDSQPPAGTGLDSSRAGLNLVSTKNGSGS